MDKEFTAFTTNSKQKVRTLKTEVTVSTDSKINSESKKSKYSAIWDTGATNTCISNRIAKEMNLIPIGKTEVSTANGKAEANTYIVTLILPNRLEISNIVVTSGNLGEDTDLLIGMDIITLGDFAITNVDNRTTFSFRTPSCEKIDYCIEAEKVKKRQLTRKQNALKRTIKQHGNEKCPCGSGKKYRYCCGKEDMKKLEEELQKI